MLFSAGERLINYDNNIMHVMYLFHMWVDLTLSRNAKNMVISVGHQNCSRQPQTTSKLWHGRQVLLV